MSTNTGIKIKICGLFREEDISYVNRWRPDYAGFVFWEKSHRNVTYEMAKELRSLLDEGICPVGVFVDEDPDKIVTLLNNGIIDIAQLHGNEPESDLVYIKERTGKEVIRAVKMKTGDEFINYKDSKADYLLLDSGMGTGKPFDWGSVDKRPRKAFFLAGGLNNDNIEKAVRLFRPYAVDLSSSVETGRVKDEEKIKQIIETVRNIRMED